MSKFILYHASAVLSKMSNKMSLTPLLAATVAAAVVVVVAVVVGVAATPDEQSYTCKVQWCNTCC